MKNLPAPRTSFVGRTAELDEIDRLLGDPDCRLLTLVGPGGAGKTRLALEAAARRVDRYPHGVHFVPLASVASPDLLAPALAESIQFAVDGAHSGFSAQEQLLDYLSERSTLLVLDNFEHLVEGSGFLSEVVERAPQVELLTTSRERLNVQSEWVFDVEGLGLAENGNGSASAVRLFVERARQAVPGFALDDAAEALRICRLVDGMPLGIELAASWVSVLSCAEIADEIEGSIDFLATSMRDVPERHRSLRAAIDQSWRLLTDEQRSAFSRLSVFRGSFDRQAAVAVTGADLRLLSELVAKSLLRRPDFGRFELHELLRQYAAEQLAASPAEEADARERHARHYAAMLLERRAALLGPELAVARDELRGELDNLRAAVEWILAHDDEHAALEVLEALNVFLWMHSWFEAAETLERLERTAGFDADDPASASPVALAAAMYRSPSGPTRLRPRGGGARTAACPSYARETWSASSHSACARWASWRCTGTSTRRRWRSSKRLGARESDRRRAHRERGPDGSRLRPTAPERPRAAREAFEAARVLFDELGTRFCAHTPRASSASSPTPRSATATRFACTWRRTTSSRPSATPGNGLRAQPRELERVRAGDYSEALRLGRAGYEAFSESQPPLGDDHGALPHRLRGARARRRRRGVRALRRGARPCARLGGPLARASCTERDRRVPRRGSRGTRAGRRAPHVRPRARAAAPVVLLRRTPGPRSARGGTPARSARLRPGRSGRGKH